MLDFLKNYLRKRALRKYHSERENCLLALSEIKTAQIFLREDDWFKNKEDIEKIFKRENIRLKTILINSRFEKGLNFYDCPKEDFLRELMASKTDLFICLSDTGKFFEDIVSQSIDARCKIAKRKSCGEIFNLVVNGSTTASIAEILDKIFSMLKTIK